MVAASKGVLPHIPRTFMSQLGSSRHDVAVTRSLDLQARSRVKFTSETASSVVSFVLAAWFDLGGGGCWGGGEAVFFALGSAIISTGVEVEAAGVEVHEPISFFMETDIVFKKSKNAANEKMRSILFALVPIGAISQATTTWTQICPVGDGYDGKLDGEDFS